MTTHSFGYRHLNIFAALTLTAMAAASCTPPCSAPEQIQSTSPRISYKYHNDQELAQANQSAGTFCSQYQSVPRTLNLTSEMDGSKSVSYECVKAVPQYVPAATVQAPYYNSSYTYRTDQELADAMRNAQTYCMNNGAQQVNSNITSNMDGSRTVTFQCSPR
jgi:hypothetical protein